ncbi:hypothetical protein [uncultured Enterovirga sp.]|uniref:hypothetical protein n=1 Tax=uncultured Enterovirga sp. TaxID=2026352 RepID=UPI0035CCA36E
MVALDQLLVYNRFGSFNPYGMIFALRRDVSALATGEPVDADACSARDGSEAGVGSLEPGAVRLKDCKRPRPLTLRANVGDILELNVENLLIEGRQQPDISRRWCGDRQADTGNIPTRRDERRTYDEQCREAARIEGEADPQEQAELRREAGGDWPATRRVSLTIPGLEPLPTADGTVHRACLGLSAVDPGERFACRFRLDREGTHLFSSVAAPSGGEGDAGSLGHGLFGALIVESEGASVLRSQVTRAAFDAVWKPSPAARHARESAVSYAVASARPDSIDTRPGAFPCGSTGVPILMMIRPCAGTEAVGGFNYAKAEIVHGDLNAIVAPDPGRPLPAIPAALVGEDRRTAERLATEAKLPFREFTVVFHDELKTFYADPFRELGEFGQLSAARDGFAINYGASGAGPMVVANRKGIGPAAGCPECLYEEFFLESWANGDPALLESYADDPSNVHHSYLNDKVVFRNFHAGKETHVFHLHTHQWFAGNDENRGAYLDSQTIGPQQGFTYRIYHGGHDRNRPEGSASGWWEDGHGSGNRNRTVGDAIFHCHLYPHFAQGMWALWRVHDVLEDGTRVLPDGQKQPGPSVSENGTPNERRLGSVEPAMGHWLGGGQGQGTPVPGLIPLPGEAAPLLPTYAANATPQGGADGMPGFPFYLAGEAGHRAPQPPLDMARGDGGRLLDGGLPRHLVTGGLALPSVLTPDEREAIKTDPTQARALRQTLVARMLALGDVTSEFERLDLRLLPHAGTRLEQNAMGFHHDGTRPGGGQLSLLTPLGQAPGAQALGGYATFRMPPLVGAPKTDPPRFGVNGAPPAPGAPFADPCGAPTTLSGAPFRRFIGHRPMTNERDVFEPATLTLTPDPAIAGDAALQALRGSLDFVPDPALLGFRRYDVSAVQFDMTVNRAGWHDPQARIAVLTSKADNWKESRSARAEPFFFRAFSGECIELRHTNDLPKDLELDDFQLKVPTDTIGQHIHLVKFDVTSSDGSGNGFNYEDGTFAADELLARICAARKPGGTIVGETADRRVADRAAECAALGAAKARLDEGIARGDAGAIREARLALRQAQLWWRKGADRKDYFQTTVQRWFADPILSNTGDGKAADRTLRTVFTHDHFGPSNIQQHGYYAALLIEPNTHAVSRFAGPDEAKSDMPGRELPPPLPGPGQPVQPVLTMGGESLVGTRAVVRAITKAQRPWLPSADNVFEYGEPIHPNAREFALAIADFALLYDGHAQSRSEFDREASAAGGDPKGLVRLVAEANCRIDEVDEAATRANPDLEGGEPIPARRGRLCVNGLGEAPKDEPASRREAGTPNPLLAGHVVALEDHAREVRAKHGRPVAPPPRPESFSQKHHDPYLVNYRNEPVPLRIGARDSAGTPFAFVRNPCAYPAASPLALPEDDSQRRNTASHNDIRHQRHGEEGDLSNVFRSLWARTAPGAEAGHGDPCTPLIEAFGQERVLLRMVQGAQEVQHTFRVEGVSFRRNVDQAFPTARSHLARLAGSPRPRTERCQDDAVARDGRPRQYRDWVWGGLDAPPGDRAFWAAFEALAAGCDNLSGVVSAQEIGLSEHFEIGGYYRSESPNVSTLREVASGPPSPDGTRTGRDLLANRSSTNPLLHPELLQGQRPGASEADLRQSLDYMYNFGSSDAVWNGAWGLIRVYDSPGSKDLGRCLRDPEQVDRCLDGSAVPVISARLDLLEPRPLPTAPTPPTAGSTAPPSVSTTAASRVATAVKLACPSSAPQVEAIMVAVRAGEILDKAATPLPGMPYDAAAAAGIFDPDGLMIVPLSLTSDLAPRMASGHAASSFYDILAGPGFPSREAVLSILKARYVGQRRPEPYVLRVNAGDCVSVLMVNALRPLGGEPDAIRDVPGDALMPKIVPLNTDPLQNGAPGDGVRPSTRVTFTLPAAITTPRAGVPFPFGVNQAPALKTQAEAGGPAMCRGAPCLPDASRATQTFYAGNLWVDTADLRAALGHPAAPWSTAIVGAGAATVRAREETGCGPMIELAILGSLFCVEHGAMPLDFSPGATGPAAANAAIVAERLVAHLRSREGQFLKAIPYAFGALPIRVAGDLIGHASHGLSGTLVVEPKGADYAGRVASLVPGGPNLVEVLPPASGEGVLVAMKPVPDCGSEPGCTTRLGAGAVREHVLLWQDGLNLWSRRWSGPSGTGEPQPWGYDDGIDRPWDERLPASKRGFVGHPLPNCPVCDDSYDLGERAVNYATAPFSRRLAEWDGAPSSLDLTDYPDSKINLNRQVFPKAFLDPRAKAIPTPILKAHPGEEVSIRVTHPAGRARQRAFVMLGASYDDVLPGFGSGHSGLLAPGKAITASICASRAAGDYLWRDGPQPIFAAGVWGHLRVDGALPSAQPSCVP